MGTRINVTTRGDKINVKTTPKNRIAINTQAGAASGVDTLRELKDVDSSDTNNNETLVYDEVSGKFVIKVLPIISGGTF